jgi:hypothetical protein
MLYERVNVARCENTWAPCGERHPRRMKQRLMVGLESLMNPPVRATELSAAGIGGRQEDFVVRLARALE